MTRKDLSNKENGLYQIVLGVAVSLSQAVLCVFLQVFFRHPVVVIDGAFNHVSLL